MARAPNTPAKPRLRKAASAPTTPDPIEIAMEAEAGDASPDSPARTLLVNQNRLVLWQIASERAGFALKVLTAGAGVALATALGVMVWQASQAEGVVLEPFTVPPALTADGVSGEVFAAHVLDELTRLRAETAAPGRAATFANDWGREIKVAIPTTGVSLGELQTALRQWLGHEIRITGEVYRTPTGLAMRARVAGRAGLRVDGPAADREALARSLAQAIYRDTQPVRYARWLTEHGDHADAIALAQQTALGSTDIDERVEAYAAWANALMRDRRPAAAIPVIRRAITLAPDASQAWWGLGAYEAYLGHPEAAHRAFQQVVRLRPRDYRVAPAVRGQVAYFRAKAANLVGDHGEALVQFEAVGRDAEVVRAMADQLDRDTAQEMSSLHDIAGAERRMANLQFYRPGQPELDVRFRDAESFRLYVVEDWAALAAETSPLAVLSAQPVRSTDAFPWSILALARANTGDAAGAEAILVQMPADNDACMINAGRARATLGDLAAGDRILAAVEARSPSVPYAAFFRGRIRLDAGDAAGALPHFREAQKRQPKWAGSFRNEGDALARLGRWTEAEAAYARAYPLAPKWGGLHVIWGEALAKLGKADEARAKWRTASGLYLTAPERARLTALLAGRPA